MQLTGAEIIIECLLEQSVDTVFGYPGGAILNVYDALYRYSDKIKHVLTSHEQGASHAADGYARATGKVGVCLATSGPGATNLVTGIATACMDSVPVVAITCNVGTALLGKDSFQEVDIAGIVMPVTKHSYIVKDVTKLADTIRKAFVIAGSGRPGPVLVDVPKIHQKSIIRLEADEVALLLDYIEHGGDDLTGQKKVYYEKTKDRDLALVTLLLGTGVRVSECVGLDIEDVDFKNNGIKVTRKGGNEMVVYFGPEVEKALKNYLEVRKNIIPVEGHEHALFYSTQRKRIGVQAVENLVKKYARQVTTTKKITPHKLRSTYGTALYQETGDIYLVADVLGHKDVNTTKKHYAALDDSRRRQAATAVKLRED